MECENFPGFIFEVKIGISIRPLNNIKIHIMNDLGNVFVFFRHLYLDFAFVNYQIKFPASSPCPMQISNSSLNITFIQLSTLTSFSSVCEFMLAFFAFLYVNPIHQRISHSSVMNTFIDRFLYIYCVVHFFLFKKYSVPSSILMFWCCSSSVRTFFLFLVPQFILYLH